MRQCTRAILLKSHKPQLDDQISIVECYYITRHLNAARDRNRPPDFRGCGGGDSIKFARESLRTAGRRLTAQFPALLRNAHERLALHTFAYYSRAAGARSISEIRYFDGGIVYMRRGRNARIGNADVARSPQDRETGNISMIEYNFN